MNIYNLAKGPKMSYPGYDVTEANLQAGGVSSLHLMFVKIRSKSQIFQKELFQNIQISLVFKAKGAYCYGMISQEV